MSEHPWDTAASANLRQAFEECEKYEHGWFHLGYYTNAAIITQIRTARAGKRYHVLRLNYLNGQLTTIGVELDIITARAIARRGMHRDSEPLKEAELKRGRLPAKTWRYQGHGDRCCPQVWLIDRYVPLWLTRDRVALRLHGSQEYCQDPIDVL